MDLACGSAATRNGAPGCGAPAQPVDQSPAMRNEQQLRVLAAGGATFSPSYPTTLSLAVDRQTGSGQEIMFLATPQAAGDIDLASTLDALRKLGPLTSPRVPVDLQAYEVSVAATSALYEPPVAA